MHRILCLPIRFRRFLRGMMWLLLWSLRRMLRHHHRRLQIMARLPRLFLDLLPLFLHSIRYCHARHHRNRHYGRFVVAY